MSQEFERLFNIVKPIIYNLKRRYHVRLWTLDDWEQEGMISLYELLEKYPELREDSRRLGVYFKTKFSNYVKDVLRKECSQKRWFNRMVYEEVGEVAHVIASPAMALDEYVAYQEALQAYRKQLSAQEQRQLTKLLAGERFSGRQAMVRRLRAVLADFREL